MARALRNVTCVGPKIASAGFHEPSLVFLTDTSTLLTDGSRAADFLGQGSCRFALVESRHPAPLAPLRIFRSRTVVGANAVMLLFATAAFGMPFVLTLYAQEVLGYSAVKFGLTSVVFPAMAAVGSIVGQSVVLRVGFRPVAAIGLALMGAGSMLLTQVSVGGSYSFWSLGIFALCLIVLHGLIVYGEPIVRDRADAKKPEAGPGPAIPEEDVQLVAEKAGVSEAEARKALEECGGEPAEAIIRLMSR